ncbi:hypothetical protein Pmani_003396 [Petrolisthes manimaculis]|uniref:Uncharacterized protein n=1 Tax=Petrolisthes manimaculis TaxID=1843537 RepID=A0AAE1UIH2_9EUCA|nr:hypothetical protein Pmani_003396 [Petrolisthes manimaculis]
MISPEAPGPSPLLYLLPLLFPPSSFPLPISSIPLPISSASSIPFPISSASTPLPISSTTSVHPSLSPSPTSPYHSLSLPPSRCHLRFPILLRL